jgi:hypothetical protein
MVVILSAAKDLPGRLTRPKVSTAHERWHGFTDKNLHRSTNQLDDCKIPRQVTSDPTVGTARHTLK